MSDLIIKGISKEKAREVVEYLADGSSVMGAQDDDRSIRWYPFSGEESYCELRGDGHIEKLQSELEAERGKVQQLREALEGLYKESREMTIAACPETPDELTDGEYAAKLALNNTTAPTEADDHE